MDAIVPPTTTVKFDVINSISWLVHLQLYLYGVRCGVCATGGYSTNIDMVSKKPYFQQFTPELVSAKASTLPEGEKLMVFGNIVTLPGAEKPFFSIGHPIDS